jgi:hypothetical protein
MSFQDLPSDTRELKQISRYRLGKLEGQKKTIFKKMTVEPEKSKFFKNFFLHNTQNYFLHRSPSTVFYLLKKIFRFFFTYRGAKKSVRYFRVRYLVRLLAVRVTQYMFFVAFLTKNSMVISVFFAAFKIMVKKLVLRTYYF